MAITVMEVLKNLPRTNCGECGQATCLAFATQVIKEGEDLNKCPHLTVAQAELEQAVRAQQEAGIGRRRESLAISLEVLQEKVAPLDFAALAPGLVAAATHGIIRTGHAVRSLESGETPAPIRGPCHRCGHLCAGEGRRAPRTHDRRMGARRR